MKGLKKKRNWLLVLFTAAVLALGITGGVIWAQEGDTQNDAAQDDTAKKSMASRVAGILGLGEEEVQDAFKQAGREMRDEKFQTRMDRLVEQGKITEDEAVAAVDWYQSRPENIGHGHRGSRLRGSGRHRSGSSFGAFGVRGAGGFAHNGS